MSNDYEEFSFTVPHDNPKIAVAFMWRDAKLREVMIREGAVEDEEDWSEVKQQLKACVVAEPGALEPQTVWLHDGGGAMDPLKAAIIAGWLLKDNRSDEIITWTQSYRSDKPRVGAFGGRIWSVSHMAWSSIDLQHQEMKTMSVARVMARESEIRKEKKDG